MQALKRPPRPEIENLGLARLIHQDVTRLEIGVNQAALMRMPHGFADLDHDFRPLAQVPIIP